MEATRGFRAVDSKAGGFFSSGSFAIFTPFTPGADLFTCSVGSDISSDIFLVSVSKMLFGGKPLKIVRSVVGFVFVDVVNVLRTVRVVDPARSHDTMHKPLAPHAEISIAAQCWGVRQKLSKNFSAARNCVEMVKHSIFDTVYLETNHVGSPLGDMRFDLTTVIRK